MAAGSQVSSGWIKTLVVNLIAVSIFAAPSVSAQCVDETYKHDGKDCCLCAAGQYLVDHCTESLKRGKCEICKDGTYNSHPTYEKSCEACRSCSEINANLEELEPCTPSSNRKCQCKKDHYCSGGTEICRSCQACTVCGPEGIKVPCTAKTDTVCNARIADGPPVGTIVGIVIPLSIIILGVVAGYIYCRKKRDGRQISIPTYTNPNDEETRDLRPLNEVDLHPLSPEIADIIGWQDMKDIAISVGITNERIDSVRRNEVSGHEQTLALLHIFIERQSHQAASQLILALRKREQNRKADEVKSLLRSTNQDVESV